MDIKGFVPRNNIFLAPMAGVTDKAFRIICREHGCGLVYSEMVSSKGLYYGSKRTGIMLDIDDREAPVVVQIFGSDPQIMGEMAEVISQNPKIALIDINMGCPVSKITKHSEGSALMREPKLAESIIKNTVLKSKKPVTVKFRKGWDETSINAVEFAKMAEGAGAAAVAVHGRTRVQMYEGKADLSIIAKVKAAVKIPVIGNGDVVSPETAKKLFDDTGCDAIMVGRGALGNPWIFDRINHYLHSEEILHEPTYEDRIEASLIHLNMVHDFKGEKGVIEMRKHLGWYLKGIRGAALLRDKINKLEDIEDIRKLLIACKKELMGNTH